MDEKTNVVNRYKVMSREKMTGDYQKTKSVIMSCDNWDQLKVGIKMYNQLNRLHELPEKDLDKLENLIGLMKIKCKNTSSYDVPEKVDEDRSPIGDEFHKEAQKYPELRQQNIVFNEDKDILKEINIGTQIEKNHLPYKQAKELAIQNVNDIPNYYSDPNYCVIAVESKNGKKKTLRVEKNVYEKSKESKEQLIVDDLEIFHEDLSTNRIAQRRRDDFRKEYGKRETPREFEQIRRVRDEKPNFEDLYVDLDSEDEIEEATGASSSGAFVGPMGGKTISRTFKKSDIPTTKNGIVGKRQTGLPIGKMYSFNEDKEVLEEEITTGNDIVDTLLGIFISSRLAGVKTKEIPQYLAELGPELILYFIKFMRRFGYSVDVDYIRDNWNNLLKKTLGKHYREGGIVEPLKDILWDGGTINYGDDASLTINKRKKDNYEEEELDEATTVGGVGGVYDTPGFPASKFMGTAGKKGKAPVKKKQPNDVLKNLGYQKVRVKEKCKTFPYCNQSPEAIEFYNEGRVVKTIKKGNLKIK